MNPNSDLKNNENVMAANAESSTIKAANAESSTVGAANAATSSPPCEESVRNEALITANQAPSV